MAYTDGQVCKLLKTHRTITKSPLKLPFFCALVLSATAWLNHCTVFNNITVLTHHIHRSHNKNDSHLHNASQNKEDKNITITNMIGYTGTTWRSIVKSLLATGNCQSKFGLHPLLLRPLPWLANTTTTQFLNCHSSL